MERTDFQVKVGAFEGPLDLLLQLIENRKMHISDISIAKVADEYVAYVKALEQFPIAESAHFILIASTLLLIKSKSLLPSLSLTEEEQGDIQNLEDRLKHLERIKALSQHVKALFGATPLFSLHERKLSPLFSPDSSMTIPNFHEAIRNVLVNLPKKELLSKVLVKRVVSLEEVIDSLSKRISGSLRMSFRDFAGVGKEEKVTIIVSFLAMLELVKQGSILVSQEAHFDDIIIESDSVGTPRYQ